MPGNRAQVMDVTIHFLPNRFLPNPCLDQAILGGMPCSPGPPPELPTVYTIDDVVAGIQTVVNWSIEAASPLGYCAALYKKTTLAIRDAIGAGVFDDGPRMAALDVSFARRYFDALNGYFGAGSAPTKVWQVAFEASESGEPIIVQHMLTAMNAHIKFDLGVAAAEVAGDLAQLSRDFTAVNEILASQVGGVVDAVERISPAVARFRHELTGDDVGVISEAMAQSRDLAWTFAEQLAEEPTANRDKVIDDHDAIFAWWGRRYLTPPRQIAAIIDAIAEDESRDVAHNIAVLDGAGGPDAA